MVNTVFFSEVFHFWFSSVEPRLSRDARECAAQQSATRCGEAPLSSDLLHPAAQEVLKDDALTYCSVFVFNRLQFWGQKMYMYSLEILKISFCAVLYFFFFFFRRWLMFLSVKWGFWCLSSITTSLYCLACYTFSNKKKNWFWDFVVAIIHNEQYVVMNTGVLFSQIITILCLAIVIKYVDVTLALWASFRLLNRLRVAFTKLRSSLHNTQNATRWQYYLAKTSPFPRQ